MKFTDRLQASIDKSSSIIVAGLDPKIDDIPACIKAGGNSAIKQTLLDYYSLALEVIRGDIAAVKPNIAFFEQFGLEGLAAFQSIIQELRLHGLPIIADAKRGDIGSTAEAYSAAFLGTKAFNVDAVTVNPFLGFDTLEPFLKDCIQHNKGIFVLVRTSNPGSADIQSLKLQGDTNQTVSHVLAKWLADNAPQLMGACGYSGLGAVVGATHPQELAQFRALMPKNFLLVPGIGAQGGSVTEVLKACAAKTNQCGVLLNVSRALLGGWRTDISLAELKQELKARILTLNQQVRQAVTSQ